MRSISEIITDWRENRRLNADLKILTSMVGDHLDIEDICAMAVQIFRVYGDNPRLQDKLIENLCTSYVALIENEKRQDYRRFEFVHHLLRRAYLDNAPLKGALMKGLFRVLARVTTRNEEEGMDTHAELAATCFYGNESEEDQRILQNIYIEQGLNYFGAILKSSGSVANKLIEDVRGMTGLRYTDFDGVCGRSDDLGIFLFHAQSYDFSDTWGGVNSAFAIKDAAATEPKFIVGEFCGTKSELLQHVRGGCDDADLYHDEKCIMQAEILLGEDSMPDFSEAVLERIATMQQTRSAYAHN